MNTSLRVLGLAVLAATLVAGHAQQHEPAAHAPGMAPGSGSAELHAQMLHGMQEMQGMRLTGDTDKDFVRVMRMHHLQGIAMARAQVEHGTDPHVKQFARRIIDSQTREVKQFDEWLQQHP